MIVIKQKHHFSSSHKLFNPSWTEEQNKKVFGPCANENWHGHNFELIVGVKGEPDNESGFVINPEKLNSLVQDKVIVKVDHKNLNLDVPFMKDKIASCENLIIEFWKILYPEVNRIDRNARLNHLRLYETPRNFVDYYGD
ncbi:6-pyruvoyltetrahydropterin/6-carboxytetrahydropterin synthase [Ekhidna lutea]|uniref:6-carboxy-5,6,7,8-tetrahydropterin synthase n=1 Tax=Ekhidna lutea TaxID=447679 RepID=A0A239K9S1_EKHLU|nr:6-carboxytetrahydropterin synthase [Ekhidna lutea]SNT14508.1 6-pyruvoyltetrahydropterin/6-carboxytetrahydropterin synthase [Ekhidna lutea]